MASKYTNRNIDIALCGEYYVASMMHLQGWTACLTPKNYPNIDIIGYYPVLGKTSNIQVKTGQDKYTVLTGLNTSNYSAISIASVWVFVHILSNDIECFVLSDQEVLALATAFVQKYQGSKSRPIKFTWKSLKPYKNHWYKL